MKLEHASGEAQLALLKTLLMPAPFYMEPSQFLDAFRAAYREFMQAPLDQPERQNWWHCMVAVQEIASIRFGHEAWMRTVRREPALTVINTEAGV